MSIDSGLACVQLISRFYGVAADSEQLRRQFVRPGERVASMDVIRMVQSLGLKSRQIKSTLVKLPKSPLPALAQDNNGEFFILAKCKTDSTGAFQSILIQRPGQEPQVKDAQWLNENWNFSHIFEGVILNPTGS